MSMRMMHARSAGALYLGTHVTSVGAVAAAAQGRPVVGALLEFALALGCVGTGVLVCLLLQHIGPARTATFSALRIVEAAVILAGVLPVVAAQEAFGGHPSAGSAGLHSAAFLVGQGWVISVNTIILGSLLWSHPQVPRGLGLWGMAGGGLILISNLGQTIAVVPPGGTVAALCAVPVFAFEIWWAVRLLLVGVPGPESVTMGEVRPTLG